MQDDIDVYCKANFEYFDYTTILINNNLTYRSKEMRNMKRSAEISECQNYRYSLERVWDPTKKLVGFIGLNPSTADGNEDDPTIRRCIEFAKSWGAGGIYMTNLFAYRATSPAVMMEQESPIGPENDSYLAQLPNKADKIVACWGNSGCHKDRANQVKELLKVDLLCLDINKTGEPKHPLYVKGNTELTILV